MRKSIPRKKVLKDLAPEARKIVEALKAAIRANGPGTAKAASEVSGVTIDSIRRFLEDERDLTFTSAVKLAAAFGYQLAKVDEPVKPSRPAPRSRARARRSADRC